MQYIRRTLSLTLTRLSSGFIRTVTLSSSDESSFKWSAASCAALYKKGLQTVRAKGLQRGIFAEIISASCGHFRRRPSVHGDSASKEKMQQKAKYWHDVILDTTFVVVRS